MNCFLCKKECGDIYYVVPHGKRYVDLCHICYCTRTSVKMKRTLSYQLIKLRRAILDVFSPIERMLTRMLEWMAGK